MDSHGSDRIFFFLLIEAHIPNNLVSNARKCFKGYISIMLAVIIIAFFPKPISAQSAEMEMLVAELVKEKILLMDVKAEVHEYLKTRHIGGRADILLALYYGERVRMLGPQRIQDGTIYAIREVQPSPEDQLKINTELFRYLQLLVKNELVQADIGGDFKKKISKNEFPSKLAMLGAISSYVEYADWLTPENLKTYAKMLHKQGIISDSQYQKLITDISNGAIKSEFQLIDYCSKAKSFRLSEYSDDPKEYVEKIHREVSSLLPELAFSDFSFNIEEDKSYETQNYKSYKLVVNLKNDGKFYQYKSFISPTDSGPKNGYFGKLSSQDFYQIFNHILAERHSPLRLHDIKSTLRIPYLSADYSKFGIIAITKAQEDALHDSKRYIEVSYENFTHSLSRKQIERGIRRWQEIGILHGITNKQIEAGKSEALLNRQVRMNDLISYFPTMVYQFPFKASTSEEGYEDILRELGRLSRGQFLPTKISVVTDKAQATTHVSFYLGQTRHQFNLKYSARWLEWDFFKHVDKIVQNSRIRGKFYHLLPVDEAGCLIYLYPNQYETLSSEQLLNFDLPN